MAPRTGQTSVRRAITVSGARVDSTHCIHGGDLTRERRLDAPVAKASIHSCPMESGRAPLWSLVAQTCLIPWSLVAQTNSRLKMLSISLRE